MKQKFLKEKDVIEKFGVPYGQVCDYLAIVGDSSDNIPGIAGF
jgi:DNA polymerase I